MGEEEVKSVTMLERLAVTAALEPLHLKLTPGLLGMVTVPVMLL